jgi:hypothetical protein
LLLSRQSIFSVFSSNEFDEVGGEIGFRPSSRLRVGGGAWVQQFGDDATGSRLSLGSKVVPDAGERVVVQLVLGRVSERENGYWSGRASIRYQLFDPAWITLEHYTYLYDSPIRGVDSSNVESLNAEWAATQELRFLLGSSVVRSPYSKLDAQALLRVSYAMDVAPERGPK